jgi:peptide/nickel transport system substrate-binding protein
MPHPLNRRRFLKASAGTAGLVAAATLAACTPAAPPTATTAPKPAAAPTAAAKPAAAATAVPAAKPAAAATTAPAAKPTAAAAAAPTAAAKPAAKPAAATGNTFVFARGGDSVKLDPAVITDGESHRVTTQVLEQLLKFDAQTTNVAPSLAQSWEVSDGGKVYVFKLRSGVKFHDGTPFDAEAVVFNFERWMDAKSPYRPDGSDFTYFKKFFGGFKNDEKTEKDLAVESVKAVSADVVQITLKRPQAPFLNNMAMFPFAIGSPTAIKKDAAAFAKAPVGTGPFKFVDWIPGDRITLEKFGDYWGDKAKVDRVIVRVIKENTARFLELKAGTIHGMDGVNPDDIKTAKADPNLQILMRPSMNIAYISFNFKNEHLAKLPVRQAIAHAINRQAIADALYSGTGVVASQFMPPSVWGYNPDIKPYPYDLEKAKSLLKDAGVPNGFSIEMWYMPVSRPYYPSPKPIAEVFAADLAKVGIKAELKTEDWAQYLTSRAEGKFPMWMLGWTGDNGDPDNFLFEFFGKLSPENSWDNKQVRDMLLQAQTLPDKAAREKLYKEAAVIINNELPRIPIAHSTPALLFRKNISGYTPHPTGTEYFHTVAIQ